MVRNSAKSCESATSSKSDAASSKRPEEKTSSPTVVRIFASSSCSIFLPSSRVTVPPGRDVLDADAHVRPQARLGDRGAGDLHVEQLLRLTDDLGPIAVQL